jgi:hypothetical protein
VKQGRQDRAKGRHKAKLDKYTNDEAVEAGELAPENLPEIAVRPEKPAKVVAITLRL